ncbi:MAG: hypothetical protein Q8O24_00330 [Gallionellaceae bacterium]|nr:hypothetical protein [Gallionellaceae bacterium]
MIAVNKYAQCLLVICVLSLISFCAHAAGLDDVLNYKQPVVVVEEKAVETYTFQDIIGTIPALIDAKSPQQARGNWPPRGEKLDAFNKKNFGECQKFYLEEGSSYTRKALLSLIEFLFEENESRKVYLQRELEWALGDLERISPELNGVKCSAAQDYLLKVKELINAIIQAAPDIKKEKQKEKQKEQEKSAKLAVCQNTNAYKLHRVSKSIEHNNSLINQAQLEMKREEEVAKISGFLDKQVMYNRGNKIALGNRYNAGLFEEYRQLGGTAKSVEQVRATSASDPCDK